MDQKTIRLLVRQPVPKLLYGPFCRRVGGHIAVQDTSRSELKNDKYVEELESSGHCNHEIAGDYRGSMIAYECGPVLG